MENNHEDLYRDEETILDFFKEQIIYKLFNKLESESKFDVLRLFEKKYADKNGFPFFKSSALNLTIVTKEKSKALELIKKGIVQVESYFDFELPDSSGKGKLEIKLIDLNLNGLISYGVPSSESDEIKAYKYLYPNNFVKDLIFFEKLSGDCFYIVFLYNLHGAESHVKSYFTHALKFHDSYRNVLLVVCEDEGNDAFDSKLASHTRLMNFKT